MSTKGIEKYMRATAAGEKLDSVIRSVNIRRDQQEFLLAHNVNLSELVRDALDKIIPKK